LVEAKGESLMDQFLLFAAGGLGAGAVYAALSLGLIVTFKATGVINFAAGVIGLWAGYIYQELRAFGEYVFPVVIIPAYVHVGRPDQLVAVLVAVATAMVLGVAVHFFVFRPLREAPALAKVVASAGVMLALQALIVLRFGPTSARSPQSFPTSRSRSPESACRATGCGWPVSSSCSASSSLCGFGARATAWRYRRQPRTGSSPRSRGSHPTS